MDQSYFFCKAEKNDSTYIAKNNIQLAQEIEQLTLSYDEAVKGSEYIIEHPKYGFYYLCKKNNELIAQLLVTYEWSDWRNKMIWWVHRVYVQPAYRKKGIFKEMMKHIEHWAKKEDIFAIRIYVHNGNTSAFTIYKKIGFHETPFTILQSGSIEI